MMRSIRRGTLAVAAAAGLLMAAFHVAAQGSQVADLFGLDGERLVVSPQEAEVPEGSRILLQLALDCEAPCDSHLIDPVLAEAGETIEWQVDGVTGGDEAVGRVVPARTDESGRVVAVSYIAPDEVPALNPVTVTAVVHDAFSRTQYQFTSEITVVEASNWTGWVNVHYAGMYDDTAGSGSAGTYEEFLREFRSERGEDPNFFPTGGSREVAWLSFNNRFTITDAFTEASDDSTTFAMLTGGASGRMTYRSRYQEPCGALIWTRRDGKAINMEPLSRMIRFETRHLTSNATVQGVPPLLYEVEGRREGQLCGTSGLYDIPVEPYSNINEAFGVVESIVRDEEPLSVTSCKWEHAVTFEETVYYADKDFRGNMTVSWCIDRPNAE